jgi:hypothetical protein
MSGRMPTMARFERVASFSAVDAARHWEDSESAKGEGYGRAMGMPDHWEAFLDQARVR